MGAVAATVGCISAVAVDDVVFSGCSDTTALSADVTAAVVSVALNFQGISPEVPMQCLGR